MEVLAILNIIFIVILAGVVIALIVKLYNNGGLESKIETRVLDENGKEVSLVDVYCKTEKIVNDIIPNLDEKIESLMKRIECLEFERDAKGEKFIVKKYRGMFSFPNEYIVRFLHYNEIKYEKITICGNEKIIAKGDYLVVEKTVELDLDYILRGCIKEEDRTKVTNVYTVIDGELKEIPVDLYTKAMKNN